MQYQVPQFIEVEDKIFGPLTLKQFIWIAGAGGIALVFVTLLPLALAVIVSAPFLALGAALAFYKVNGRPLIFAIEHAFNYYLGHKLYLWHQRDEKKQDTQAVVESRKAPSVVVPKLSESRLKDLAWSLNIKDRQKLGVMNEEPTGFEL